MQKPIHADSDDRALDFAVICHVIRHIWSCVYSTRKTIKKLLFDQLQ